MWHSTFTFGVGKRQLAAMLKSAAWMLSPLCLLSWGVMNAQVLPEPGKPSPVDTITPVPLPEIPLGSVATAVEMPKELKIENQGGKIEGDAETGLRLGGPVKITGDNGLEMFANTAVLDLKTKSVTLNGQVSVYQGNMLQRGERAVYFYERKFLDASGLRASLDPVLLEAGKFTVEQRGGKQVFVGHDAGITTHDVENPNYWVRAGKTTIYPGEKIIFNDLKLFAGEKQVFWLPYLSQPLDSELGYHFVPGARSNWGPFLLNTYGIMLGGDEVADDAERTNQWLLSRWHFDIRSTRGLGTGFDLVDKRIPNRDEISGLSLYYINDLDPGNNRTGIPRGFVNEDRFKYELKDRFTADFHDGADWRLDTNLTWLSDRYYLEDFDMVRYRTDPAPDNTVGIFRRDDRSLLSLYARFRINDFYRSDTRLPEVSYDQARAPFFGLPILHEGSTSVGLIGEQAPDVTRNAILNPLMTLTLANPAAQPLLQQLGGYERRLAEHMLALPVGDSRRDAIRAQLLDSSYARFHTYQQWSMPMMFGGALSVTPQAGIGYTRYGAVDGPVDGMGNTVVHAGVESALKFTKDYGSIQDARWGVNGLLHVLQPYASWSVVSTDDFDPGDPAVDRLTPTTRPRPLDPIRFTAIDEMQSWNVIRLGTRNRLITHRDQQSFEWLFMDTYIDTFINDPEGTRTFSNLYNDIRWQPLPWMGVDLNTQFPIANNGSGFSEFATRLRFMPTDRFEFSLGYRWLANHPVLTDSNRFDISTYTRLTENWGVSTRHVLELDDGMLELQQYTLNRDLGNWVVGLGVSSRDNRYDSEYGAVLSLTLKDFPSATLPFRIDGE